MWLVGVNAAQEGYGAIELLRDPLTGNFGGSEEARSALVNALGQHAQVQLPLSIAQLLLGSLLLLVATHLLFGGRPSRWFAVQVLVANAVFLVTGYALRESFRATYISALLVNSEHKAALSNEFWWRTRFVLAFDLTAVLFSIFALTRPATRQFLDFRPEPNNE